MSEKIKKTIDEQIEYMKDIKDISFKNYDVESAKSFMENSSYFFKLKSFAKLFDKDPRTKKYWNLGFDQLVELSKLDLYLRRILFKMCLSIEHQLKLNLLNDISEDSKEDGYTIVDDFFKKNSKIFDKYKKIVDDFHGKPTYSSNILVKYFSEMPIWVIVEIFNFSEFLKLHEFYYSTKAQANSKTHNNKIENFSWSIRIIRNACAHNNCILNSLKNKNENYNFQLLTELSKINIKLTSSEKEKLKYCVVNDIIIIIVFFNSIITSTKLKDITMNEFKKLLNQDFDRRKVYFDYKRKDNKFLIDSYRVLKKIVDNC